VLTMKREDQEIRIYTSPENAKLFEDALDKEVIRLTKGKKVKQYTQEELEEKKRKTDEDYNKMAKKLNHDYKNPGRYVDRKYGKKEKFGKSIVKRLNQKKK